MEGLAVDGLVACRFSCCPSCRASLLVDGLFLLIVLVDYMGLKLNGFD
jgi:hypothetical protein